MPTLNITVHGIPTGGPLWSTCKNNIHGGVPARPPSLPGCCGFHKTHDSAAKLRGPLFLTHMDRGGQWVRILRTVVFLTRGPWWTMGPDPVDRCFSRVVCGRLWARIPWTVVFSHVDRGGLWVRILWTVGFSHVDRGGPWFRIPWTVVFSHVDRGGP